MAEELHLSAAHAQLVRDTLRRYLPQGSRVRVFGSRATGRGVKPHSDLDLLIDSPGGLPLAVIGDLREAFAESDLPFAVDLVQASDAAPGFLNQLESGMTLDLSGEA